MIDSAIKGVYPAGKGFATMTVSYVMDVQPETRERFRTHALHDEGMGVAMLDTGDTVNVRIDKHQRVEIVEKGVPRFDPSIRENDDAKRQAELLNQPPSSASNST